MRWLSCGTRGAGARRDLCGGRRDSGRDVRLDIANCARWVTPAQRQPRSRDHFDLLRPRAVARRRPHCDVRAARAVADRHIAMLVEPDSVKRVSETLDGVNGAANCWVHRRVFEDSTADTRCGRAEVPQGLQSVALARLECASRRSRSALLAPIPPSLRRARIRAKQTAEDPRSPHRFPMKIEARAPVFENGAERIASCRPLVSPVLLESFGPNRLASAA